MESKKTEVQQILFFDGVCHLCNGFVDFMIQNENPKKDQSGSMIYAPLQGETAKLYLSETDRKSLQSVLFYEKGKVYRESEAILKIANHLKEPWRSLSRIGKLIPHSLRQSLYRAVAKNRYKLFGEREFCRLPEPHERAKLWP